MNEDLRLSKINTPMAAKVILICGLLITFIAWSITNDFAKRNGYDRFLSRADEVRNAIEERMKIYEQVLWSTVGLFYASDAVSRVEFKHFIESLKIEMYWPGLQGVGFAIPLKPEELAAHEQKIRSEGFTDYKVKPEGERDAYSSIIYLEPFDWRNQRAFGYDMWSNEVRREAMQRARDSGLAATSGIITLVQETTADVQKGFLTYVPLYKHHAPYLSDTERRKEFVGWVYAPFRAGDLMKGVLGMEDPKIKFQIYEGEQVNETGMLFSSNDSNVHNVVEYQSPEYVHHSNLELQGRIWTIHFQGNNEYLSSQEKSLPNVLAAVGLVLDFLLYFVVNGIAKSQTLSKQMVEKRTAELQEKINEMRELNQKLDHATQSKSKFFAQISHEIRTPLNGA